MNKRIFILFQFLIFSLFLSQGYAIERLNGFDISNASVKDEIKQGGPPKDGIPALTDPKFLSASQALKMFKSTERALVITYDSISKAYPISILNWHEVVNDSVKHKPFVITYCPLCGTGIVFKAQIDGKRELFGVSGLLYKSDVLLYDKSTESLWSQIGRTAISGERKDSKLKIYPSKIVNLHSWLKKHPKTYVLSSHTGYQRDYFTNPYQGYESNDTIVFPFYGLDHSEGLKTWTLYVAKGQKSYLIPFSRLKDKKSPLYIKHIGKVTFDIRTKKIECPSHATCIQGYWFALKGFYPKAQVVPHK